jgi:hypothetical protein
MDFATTMGIPFPGTTQTGQHEPNLIKGWTIQEKTLK